MIKKYKLLKDTPESKAGTIFEYRDVQGIEKDGYKRWIPEGYYNKDFVFTGQDCAEFFPSVVIENKPDWFKEIKSFVTKDGKQVFEGLDDFWYISSGVVWKIDWSRNTLSQFENFDIFSTKELSDQRLMEIKEKVESKYKASIIALKDIKTGIKFTPIHCDLFSFYKNDFNVIIYKVKRESDGKIFTVGDIVAFREDKPGNRWIIDNFCKRDNDGQLLARSKDCEMVELVDEDLIQHLSVRRLKQYVDMTKKQASPFEFKSYGPTMSKEGINKLMNALFTGEIIGKQTFDEKGAGKITSQGVDFGKEKDQLVQSYITVDDQVVKDGDKIYGIAIQASGNDRWKEQILPFADGQKISSRIWFASKKNANQYLIENSKLFSISDLFQIMETFDDKPSIKINKGVLFQAAKELI